MHELTIAQSIVRAAQAAAEPYAARQIDAVRVRVGALRSVVPDLLDMGFEAAALGTPVEGAKLSVELVPGAARCRSCQNAFEIGDLFFVCPACDGVDVETVGGMELTLMSIELTPKEVPSLELAETGER